MNLSSSSGVALRRHVQPGNSVKTIARGGKQRQYLAVVTGNDVGRTVGEPLNDREAVQHLVDVEHHRKRPPLQDVGVVMGSVRSEDDVTAPRPDPHHLKPLGMSTHPVQRYAIVEVG